MFIGHYSASFLGTAVASKVKLWHGFVAVQLIDFAWAAFILLGIEHVRIEPGFTEANALDLYHMPYTHSLVMVLVWAAGAGLLYGLLRRSARLWGAVIIGLMVLSHWVLDYLMHVPDLELWIGGPKVGMGLWRDITIAFPLEIGLMLAGFAVYMLMTKSKGRIGATWPWIFVALMVALQYFGTFGPPPPDPKTAAASGLIAYVILTLGAAGLDVTRAAK